MTIRPIAVSDTESLFEMMCRLDEETPFMLYEPGEREERTRDLTRLQAVVGEAVSGPDLMLAAVGDGGEIAGYLWAERGRLNRTKHTASVVTGIRRAFRRQGIGDEFFRRLESWARQQGIVRLELTVMCENTAAKNLYEKHGFVVEGIRRKTMRVDGVYADEYGMAKILGGEAGMEEKT